MKKIFISFIILLIFYVPARSNVNSISDYVFTQTMGTFTSIHTTGTLITAGCTSSVFSNLPIGFTFIYNGITYTQFGLCCSGWISLGPGTPATSIYPLSTGSTNNVISPFAAQLSSTVAGDGIFYKTEGSVPNRVLTVEWWQYGFWFNGFDEICFQIKLYETTNQINFVYTTNDELSIRNIQVGLRGFSNADFNNRQTTTNWSQTTAGTTNTATCLFSPGITPPSGLTFIFTPLTVGIANVSTQTPYNFKLYQNYPNPFNPNTIIRFQIKDSRQGGSSTNVKLTVLDILGKEVATLVNEDLKAGTYEVNWNAEKYSSGIYFYKLISGNFSEVKRMVLIK
jgi:hypothetical protein